VHQAKYMKKIFKKSRWMTRSPCRHWWVRLQRLTRVRMESP
jgi:hypothetical protein